MLNPFRKTLNAPQKQKSEKCEIVVERKGDKVIKRIKGACTKEQLEALSGSTE